MICLKNARLIDGTGAPPRERITVLVEGARILAVGPEIPAPDGAEVLDLQGATLLPGMTEAHIHLGGASDVTSRPLAGRDAGRYERALSALLDCGVTNARSAADYERDILRLRAKVACGQIEGPRLWVPGKLFQAPDGHPAYTVWGSDPEILAEAVTIPATEEQVRWEILRQAEAGVDHVKLMLSDVDYLRPGRVAPKLSPALCAVIVQQAHAAGRRVMVHAQTPQDALLALEAGADSIEHLACAGYDLRPAPAGLAEAFLNNGAYLVPTLSAGYFGHAPADFMAYTMGLVRALYERGVRLAVGTDSGTPHVEPGTAFLRELCLLTEAGIPPMAVLTAATRGGAELVGCRDYGLVKSGRLADLVAVAADPLTNMENMAKTLLVLKEGKVVRNFM